MCQIFIILLRAGQQNNARLKPVRSAKKFIHPCNKSIVVIWKSTTEVNLLYTLDLMLKKLGKDQKPPNWKFYAPKMTVSS